jgi:RNA polymerase sigma-70 factor (ECF subfamily)
MIATMEASRASAGMTGSGGDLAGLLAAVASGDRSSLAQLYRSTSAKLFGICLRVLRNEAEAEETLQDIFVTIWNKARLYDPGKASPLTWLSVLARNKAVDRVRIKRIDTGELDEAAEFPDDGPSAFDVLEAADDRRGWPIASSSWKSATAR